MNETGRAATLNRNISKITKILMAREGIDTQKQLAQQLGRTSPWLSRRMDGKRSWQVEELEELAKLFDVSVALFFEEPEAVVRNRCSPGERPFVLAA